MQGRLLLWLSFILYEKTDFCYCEKEEILDVMRSIIKYPYDLNSKDFSKLKQIWSNNKNVFYGSYLENIINLENIFDFIF